MCSACESPGSAGGTASGHKGRRSQPGWAGPAGGSWAEPRGSWTAPVPTEHPDPSAHLLQPSTQSAPSWGYGRRQDQSKCREVPAATPRALQALARFLESQQASPASLSLTAREQWPVGPSSWPLAASARLGLLGAPSQDCCLLHWMDSAQQTMPRTEPRKLPRCSRGWLCALILSGSDTISQGCAALPAPRHLAGPGQWPSVSRNI